MSTHIICGLFHDPDLDKPNRYDVELAETAFCCGGIRNPCTTPGCTECGTHFQPLVHATSGAGDLP